jgi:hypothetical protein
VDDRTGEREGDEMATEKKDAARMYVRHMDTGRWAVLAAGKVIGWADAPDAATAVTVRDGAAVLLANERLPDPEFQPLQLCDRTGGTIQD